MGFKRVDLKDLETKLSPAFIGLPVKQVEDLEQLIQTKEVKETKKLGVFSEVALKSEEIVDYEYDNNGNLSNFVGTGSIQVVNNSQKARIWDSRLKLARSENVNLDLSEEIKLENFDPQTSKVISYNLIYSDNLPKPLIVKEKIDVVNILTENVSDIQFQYVEDISDAEDENIENKKKKKKILSPLEQIENDYMKKEENLLAAFKEKYDDKIEGIQKRRDDAKSEIAVSSLTKEEYKEKKKSLKSSIKKLKKDVKKHSKRKEKAYKKALKSLNIDDIEYKQEDRKKLDKFEKQIQENNAEKEKINKQYSKKEEEIRRHNDKKYNPDIEKLSKKVEKKTTVYEEHYQNAREWDTKVKTHEQTIKDLEYKQITKNREKDKEISNKKKEFAKEKKAKLKAVGDGNTDVIAKIEEETQEKESMFFEKTNAKYNEQLDQLNTQIDEEKAKLDEATKTLAKWSEKENKSKAQLDAIKEELNNLSVQKSNELNSALESLFIERRSKIGEVDKMIGKIKANIEEINNKTLKRVADEQTDSFSVELENVTDELKEKESELESLEKYKKSVAEKKNELSNLIETLENEIAELTHERNHQFNEKIDDMNEEKELKILQTKEKLEQERLENQRRIEAEKALKLQQEVQLSVSKKLEHEIERKLVLLFNRKNSLKFTLELQNTSKNLMRDIKIGKRFSEEFSNFRYEGAHISKIDIKKGSLLCRIKELKPGEFTSIVILTDIVPEKKTLISTGGLQVSYIYEKFLMSGLEVEDFSAYSHAMHAIKVKEKETEPNKWSCCLYFKNNSDLDLELKSAIILDKDKEKSIADIKYDSDKNKKILSPGEQYFSELWEVEDENEPKFFRKLEYTVTYNIEKTTRVNLKIEGNAFDIIDLSYSKNFSISSIKSFEESQIENTITIKNIGTMALKSLSVREMIPADYIVPIDKKGYILRTSSGVVKPDKFELNIVPNNANPSVDHKIEFLVNTNKDSQDQFLDVNEFLEFKYKILAVAPDHRKKYDFPLDLSTYYQNLYAVNEREQNMLFKFEYSLNPNLRPKINIIHKRRDLLIGKEIFPGRTTEEFGISIMVTNNSNVEVNDIKIDDTLSNAFELVSSNVEYKLIETKDKASNSLEFVITSLLPYQETEIRYYVKKKSGEKIDFAELESFIFG